MVTLSEPKQLPQTAPPAAYPQRPPATSVPRWAYVVVAAAFSMNESLWAAMKNLRVMIEESKAVITHDELPAVVADGQQLTQLFQNLLGNAMEFRTDEPPKIHLSAQRQGNSWVFSVADNGIGIESQYAERVFMIFQRLHTRDRSGGTGIGLAICKKIVEHHHGRIWVESQPGEGSVFRFTLGAEAASQ